MKSVSIISALGWGWATLCVALQPQFGFYTELDCNGDALIFKSKQPNVEYAAPIISNSQSYQLTGLWSLFDGVNYTIVSDDKENRRYPYDRCYNSLAYQNTKSLRHMGPPDTTMHSVSLYSEFFMAGQEFTTTESTAGNIPFEPKSILSTGNTSWTFYTGNNFDGVATCFHPLDPLENGWFTPRYFLINSTLSNVRSISKGCN